MTTKTKTTCSPSYRVAGLPLDASRDSPDIAEVAEQIVREYEASQEPRIRIEPAGIAYSDGPDAALLCETYWFKPDEWQRSLLDCWLSRDEDGRLLVITAGLSVPRQNGKNGAVEALEFYLLVTDPNAHILHTAHRVKTVKKAHKRLAQIFLRKGRRWKRIRELVARVRWTNGEEAIEMKSGATIEYTARSTNGGRGFDNITLVIYDEAQALTNDQLEAINATMAASATGDRQAIFTGTPPGPNVHGGVFRKRRTAALTNPTPHTSWHEWSVEEKPDENATWEEILPLVYQTNPAMEVDRPSKLSEVFTREEYDSYELDGFSRERLGWWDEHEDEAAPPAIDPEVWERTAIPAIARKYQGIVALCVKFSMDGTAYALAGCKMKRDRSRCAFELVEIGNTSKGTKPLATAIAKRKGTVSVVLVDGQSKADALCGNLAEIGVPKGYVMRMQPKDVIAASQTLVDGLVDGTVAHSTKGQAHLDECAATATRREIGRKGGWGFDGSIEMEACAGAVMGARTTKRNPKRKQKVLM